MLRPLLAKVALVSRPKLASLAPTAEKLHTDAVRQSTSKVYVIGSQVPGLKQYSCPSTQNKVAGFLPPQHLEWDSFVS